MEDFKGIWIPTSLLKLDISWTKRILIAEISQLEILDKGCIASNSHFSNKLKISNSAISKALNELNKDGLITINNSQTKRNFGRSITINFSKSAINFSKSAIYQSGESKENKTTTITINTFDGFIKLLKQASKYKSKVTSTKQAPNLYKEIFDKQKLFDDYLKHQEDKKDFAVRITSFMEDYNTVHSSKQEEILWL